MRFGRILFLLMGVLGWGAAGVGSVMWLMAPGGEEVVSGGLGKDGMIWLMGGGVLAGVVGVLGVSVVSGVWLIVRRSLRQHMVSTVITGVSVAMGCGLLMAVSAIHKQSADALGGGTGGFDAVVGPGGSELQVVLNSIYHLDKSPGKLPWSEVKYLKGREAKRRMLVKYAYPIMVGDRYREFRVVGTEAGLFKEHELGDGRKLELAVGRYFEWNEVAAVAGSFAAARTGLKVGSTFRTNHGGEDHEMDITVVGVLKPTNTPFDRAIWIPLEAYWRMPSHMLESDDGGRIPYIEGGNARGYSVAATRRRWFSEVGYLTDSGQKAKGIKLREGRLFEEGAKEIVVGATAADGAKGGRLKIGDKVRTYQTAEQPGGVVLTVVGIAERTGSWLDDSMWVSEDVYWGVRGRIVYAPSQYVPREGVAIPEEFKEVSAVLVKTLTGGAAHRAKDHWERMEERKGVFAGPIGSVVAELFGKMGWLLMVLKLIAMMVVVVAVLSIMASIYNSMRERRREFAILRALGARRGIVVGAIVVESGVIALLGSLGAFVVYGVLLGVAAGIVRAEVGVVMDVWAFDGMLLVVPVGAVLVGAVAGLVPAMKAYGTDVAGGIGVLS